MNYYNEHDPKAAAWLRELIAQGHLPPGFVDSRDIQLVQPADLVGYTQCHFFAGIGGWSLALLLAGIPTTTRLWTGSCPCQPFSVAGKGLGKKDPRHLWPQFRRLIRLCRPPVVLGEQVASAAGRLWLSGVCADLEALAYRTAAADLCAAGGAEDCEVGLLRGDTSLAWERATLSAPHIRQRLWWCAGRLADAEDSHRRRQQSARPARRWWNGPAGVRSIGGMGLSDGPRWEPGQSPPTPPGHRHPSESAGCSGRLDNPNSHGEKWSGRTQFLPDAGCQTSASHERLANTHSGECGRLPAGQGCQSHGTQAGWDQSHCQSQSDCPTCRMAHSPDHGCPEYEPEPGSGTRRLPGPSDAAECAGTGGLGHTHGAGLCEQCRARTIQEEQPPPELRGDSRSGGGCSSWAAFDLIPCRDGKARRIESGTFPLVDGLPGRVGLLRGYGNAINPQIAAQFIHSALESLQAQSEAGTPACSCPAL